MSQNVAIKMITAILKHNALVQNGVLWNEICKVHWDLLIFMDYFMKSIHQQTGEVQVENCNEKL